MHGGWKIFTGLIIAGSSQPERRQATSEDQIRAGKELEPCRKKGGKKKVRPNEAPGNELDLAWVGVGGGGEFLI